MPLASLKSSWVARPPGLQPPSPTNKEHFMLFRTISLAAVAGPLILFAGAGSAHAGLLAASWTQQASSPTSSLGGTLSPATITGTTGAFSNAGSVSTQDWNSFGFVSSSGLGTITQVGNATVALGFAGNNTPTTQTFNFAPAIVNPYLFFNFTDNGETYDFSSVGAGNVILVSASNASLSNGIVTSTGGNTGSDGFIVQLAGSFSSVSFPINKTSAADSVYFTAVPEPTSMTATASAIGLAALLARTRRHGRREA